MSQFLSSFWGFGLGSATELSGRFGYSGPHNAFIEMALETGLAGLALIFLATVIAFRMLLRVCDANGRKLHAPLALFAALVAHAFIENNLFALGTTLPGIFYWQFIIYNTRNVSRKGLSHTRNSSILDTGVLVRPNPSHAVELPVRLTQPKSA